LNSQTRFIITVMLSFLSCLLNPYRRRDKIVVDSSVKQNQDSSSTNQDDDLNGGKSIDSRYSSSFDEEKTAAQRIFTRNGKKTKPPLPTPVPLERNVVVIPGYPRAAHNYQGTNPVASDRELLLLSTESKIPATNIQMLMSSHPNLTARDNIHASSDGFVRGTIEAWAQHQHLVIRPDDVWFTILTQMNFYMTKNGDKPEIREVFVSHEGKEKIFVAADTLEGGVIQFQYEIQKRVKTEWLLEWIQPNFSTSTPADGMTANVLMMGLMRHYFEYYDCVTCGIPSITLKGEKADWERLLSKLNRFAEFGREPSFYADALRPILTRFVKTFEDPTNPDIRKFWSQIVSAEFSGDCGGPPFEVTGWIVGFHYWKPNGNALCRTFTKADECFHIYQLMGSVVLDGILYAGVGTDDIPACYATVPIHVKLLHEKDYIPSEIVVGVLGKKITKGIPAGFKEALNYAGVDFDKMGKKEEHGILEPISAWFLYRTLGMGAEPGIEPKGKKESVHDMIGRAVNSKMCTGRVFDRR
jgi:hypothetical protein